MVYFTIAKWEYGYVIDSISTNKELLKNKFPNETIYESEEPILSIYILYDKISVSS